VNIDIEAERKLFNEAFKDYIFATGSLSDCLEGWMKRAALAAPQQEEIEIAELRDDQIEDFANKHLPRVFEPVEVIQFARDCIAASPATPSILEAAYAEIQKLVKEGSLPGNGFDKTAERNGLILASNVIASMISDSTGKAPTA